MKAFKQGVRLAVMLVVSVLMIACPEPSSAIGGIQDEFEVALGSPGNSGAAGRSTINDDGAVAEVYAKVYNSSNVHLPAVDNTGSDIPGISKLTSDGGNWSATISLVSPASGTLTFKVWAFSDTGELLYDGETLHTVGKNGNLITIATQAVSGDGMDPDYDVLIDEDDPFWPLKARFVVSPNPQLVGSICTFDASSSFHTNPSSMIVSYRWDFSMGAKDPIYFEANAVGATVNHSFSEAGTYIVGLMIVDQLGKVDYAYSEVVILPP